MQGFIDTWKAGRIQAAHQRLRACWNPSTPPQGMVDTESLYRDIQRNLASLDIHASVFAVFKVDRQVRTLEKVIYHQNKLLEIDRRR